MVESPLAVIFEMVIAVLQNSVSTLYSLFGMSGELFRSVGFMGSINPLGLVLGAIVLVLVLFFLGKFVLKSIKFIIILFIIGLILLFVLFG